MDVIVGINRRGDMRGLGCPRPPDLKSGPGGFGTSSSGPKKDRARGVRDVLVWLTEDRVLRARDFVLVRMNRRGDTRGSGSPGTGEPKNGHEAFGTSSSGSLKIELEALGTLSSSVRTEEETRGAR